MTRPALLAAAALLGGCATFGTLQTAETVGDGNMQFAVEPAAFGAASPDGGGCCLVYLSFAGRFGVSDRTDLGFRVGTSGAEFLSKFMLTDPDGPGPKISFAPSGGGFALAGFGGGAGLLHFQLPLIIGIPVGDNQVVLAPKIHDWFGFGTGGGDGGGFNLMSVGGSIGFAGRVSDNVTILPELALVRPVLISGAAGGSGVSSTIDDSVGLFQFSVGFLIGRRPDKFEQEAAGGT